MPDLSVIIPARNEEFLQCTIEDVLSKAEADTEVIAVLDGYWPEVGLSVTEKVTVIHHENSIGQRAAMNEGVRLSQAKYIMKLDAHCSMDQGFDVKLMADCEYNWTVLPRMYVLDAFHWKCLKCGKHSHQGPQKTECVVCGKDTKFERKMIWKRKKRKRTDYMWINEELRIKYFDGPSLRPYGDVGEIKKRCSHKKRDWAKGDITDVMVGIGACWFQHRDYYWELGGLDENHGSWGQVAVELACKTWLSGGRQVVNKKTWFAHLPRTQQGFGFPYPHKRGAQEVARKYSRDLWMNNKWEGQKYPLDWLIDKFGPLPGWEAKPKKAIKGLVYYTDNQLEERIAQVVRRNLDLICNGYPIVSVSLYPITFGQNIDLPYERSAISMFRQILAGLKAIDTEIVFLTEHDILYHPSHFDFVPPKDDTYFYNTNVWQVDVKSGRALFYGSRATSGLCANRELLIEHYTKRIEKIEKEGFTRNMGFEPGKSIRHGGIDDNPLDHWQSKHPNIDLCHNNNFTWRRWNKKHFRKKPEEWIEADEVPFWGKTKGQFDEFLREVNATRTF